MGGAGSLAGGGSPVDSRTIPTIEGLINDALALRRPISLDSPALIAYVSQREPFASLIAPIIDHPQIEVTISVIVLTETITPPQSDPDHQIIDDVRRFVIALPRIRIVDFNESMAVEVATIRSQTGLKLPDAAAIATARMTKAVAILGNDRRWKTKPLGVPYLHLDDIVGSH